MAAYIYQYNTAAINATHNCYLNLLLLNSLGALKENTVIFSRPWSKLLREAHVYNQGTEEELRDVRNLRGINIWRL